MYVHVLKYKILFFFIENKLSDLMDWKSIYSV